MTIHRPIPTPKVTDGHHRLANAVLVGAFALILAGFVAVAWRAGG